MKRVKKSIGEAEYKKLIAHTKGDETLKDFSRIRLLRIFTLLFFTGIRINEVSQLKFKHIKKVFADKEITIKTHKTDNERILYFTDAGVRELRKYFLGIEDSEDNHFVISSWGKPATKLHPISLISSVNNYMKRVLGDGYSSHSFRQGLLTEMGVKGINPKIIQSFIGHSDVKTTLRYIRPTENDVKKALVR